MKHLRPASVRPGAVPVTFVNRAGLRLFGILEQPASPVTHDLAVILLSPGIKMRVGPQRLYRGLSNQLVASGLPVFRFDFFGLGDSEGTLTEDLLRDLYNHIEVGRFVDDAVDAMDWMQRTHGAKRFILSGLCGGAITGLLAGARDPRVAGLLALGITPVLASRAADASRYMTRGQLEQVRARYLRRLFSPQAWSRLLTLKTDNRLIWRLLTESFRRKPAPAAAAAPPPDESDNANPLFPPAFFRMLDTARPMLLVFGGTDRLQFEFEEKFVARHRERLARSRALYDVHIVKDANHVLSTREWQADMLDVTGRWIARHFARETMPATS
jgi:pimeloyl-ACP methyl ester carboxylesterase